MGNSGANDQANGKNGGIVVAFASHKELTARAAARKGKGQTGSSHEGEQPHQEAV